MNWQVVWSDRGADDLRRLARGDPNQARRISRAVEALAETGRGDTRQLRGQGHPGAHRLRVGEWRVLFDRDTDSRTLTIRRVQPRGRVYRD